MAGEKYKHLFLSGSADTHGFTSPRQGGSSPRIRVHNKRRHSSYLRGRLNAAWAAFDHQQAVIQVEREGAYLEFKSEPGFDLIVKSLEAMGSGIRLLNVRTEREGEETRSCATVFVPLERRGHFLRKIQKYATEIDGRSNKPKNYNLINSISVIQLAVLESFWRSEERSSIPRGEKEWVEVWLRGDIEEVGTRFLEILEVIGVECADGTLKFPERQVKLILANQQDLEQIIATSDVIAEFRLAKEIATFYVEMENQDQRDQVRELINRTDIETDNDAVVCLLDTGVNNAHTLISPLLDINDMHSVDPSWGVDDHSGHGTLMAGAAIYGDLLDHLNNGNRVQIRHRIESVKYLPPPPNQNPKRLWGYLTSEGISRAEIQAPNRKRVTCIAITSSDSLDRGRPSSWSGAVDELAAGYEDEKKRLIVISAGNVDESADWVDYPDSNLTKEIQDPAQAWNALTVGASTEKTRIVHPTLTSWTPVAPAGGLSPYSTTSLTWPPRQRPIKPEVVIEGGNIAKSPNGSTIGADDLQLLSTYYDPQVSQFASFCATSAASAQVARMAAQIQVDYPELWPEAIRALIVQSAKWTETMKSQFLRNQSKTEYARLLRICGYGVPDLERALYCMTNSLTLISQASLQPYDKRNGSYVTRDMHLYALPWPIDELRRLGETQVSMRVTLSYFVEPSPSEVGWDNRYRYASHGLRFDVNGPGESENEFVQRINKQARDDGKHPGTEGVSQSWMIGEARNVGSIHSDIWQGNAAELAESNKIAVYPAVGWWRERHHLGRWNRECRYALLISIHTPEESVDIYTPVAVQLGIATPVTITTR